MTIFEKLLKIQNELNAPKNLHNNFGNYSYRSFESILIAVKPLLNKHGLVILCSDDVESIGDRVYVKASLNLIDADSKEEVGTHAYAREALTKKGMDDSQITGAASSYARKYAANAMFAIDDTKDADTDEFQKTTRQTDKLSEDQIEKIAGRAAVPKEQKSTTSTAPASDKQKGVLNKYNIAYEPTINKTEASKLIEKAFEDADLAREQDRSDYGDHGGPY